MPTSAQARRRQQTLAIAALLKALPEQQLADVLKALGIEQAPAPRRPARLCRVCGLIYPKCRARWEGDHDFEAPLRKPGGDQWQDDPRTTATPTEPTSRPSAPEASPTTPSPDASA